MEDERGIVIGREMADALQAEARRQGSDPPPSPLPPEHYAPEHLRLLDPQPAALDEALRRFVRDYRGGAPETRALLRDGIGTDDAYTLLGFARRQSVFALRAGDIARVADGLSACAAVGYERIDPRDALVALALLHHAAVRCGADPAPTLGEAARLGEPAFVELVDGFLARPAEDRDLRDAWGHVEVEGPGGIGLLRWGFRAWAPRSDLTAACLRAADALRGDDYDIDDPELAVEIPAIWLGGSGDPSLEGTMGAVRGAAVIGGRLRGAASPEAHAQQLTAWVAELEDADAARQLVRLSETPWVDTATAAVVHGARFGLLIARSFMDGIEPYEDGPRLTRFAEPLRQALAD